MGRLGDGKRNILWGWPNITRRTGSRIYLETERGSRPCLPFLRIAGTFLGHAFVPYKLNFNWFLFKTKANRRIKWLFGSSDVRGERTRDDTI